MLCCPWSTWLYTGTLDWRYYLMVLLLNRIFQYPSSTTHPSAYITSQTSKDKSPKLLFIRTTVLVVKFEYIMHAKWMMTIKILSRNHDSLRRFQIRDISYRIGEVYVLIACKGYFLAKLYCWRINRERLLFVGKLAQNLFGRG